MTVDEIIKQVRLCIDEESNNSSSIADEKDDEYMDNIIKAKIPDALHWIATTATSSSAMSSSTTMSVSAFEDSEDIGVVTMPSGITVFNINRVRVSGWHKAVIPIEDTDMEEAQMFNDQAKGTVENPMAAIMRVTPMQLLVQPKPTAPNEKTTISYVGVPNDLTTGEDGTSSVDIPESFKSSFIYYIAFLLLSAYEDTKATAMYTIALQQLGINQSSKQ